MKVTAYYYQIIHNETKEIIDEGIIRDSEDTIFPRQNTGIKDLPYECEAHHFHAKGYTLVGWYFEVSREQINQGRLVGFGE